jgi:hypothetical protein
MCSEIRARWTFARATSGVVDAWWGGRPIAPLFPELFFIHFRDTSFVAERDGTLGGSSTSLESAGPKRQSRSFGRASFIRREEAVDAGGSLA